jgi:hypothetical protein
MLSRRRAAMMAAWALCAAALGITPVALAATDGGTGPTSTGTVNISAVVGAHVSITHLSDLPFTDNEFDTAIASGTSAFKAEDVCIWSNLADQSYFVTAIGSGLGGAFSITNGANAPVTYHVQWAQSAGQTSGLDLISGVKSPKFLSSAAAPGCGGANNASLVVLIPLSGAAVMLNQTVYAGTLTLIVTPD